MPAVRRTETVAVRVPRAAIDQASNTDARIHRPRHATCSGPSPGAMPPSLRNFGDLDVVQIDERKVGVAGNATLGQMSDGDITAFGVQRISPYFRHLQADAPCFLPWARRSSGRNVIAVDHQDRDPGEPQEVRQRDRAPSSVSKPPGTGLGMSFSGKA